MKFNILLKRNPLVILFFTILNCSIITLGFQSSMELYNDTELNLPKKEISFEFENNNVFKTSLKFVSVIKSLENVQLFEFDKISNSVSIFLTIK
jgi:hypothetical protein